MRVTLLDHEELKPSGILQSKGSRADIFRSIVVFLHATFEDAVRSQIPRKKPNIPWNFYAKADLYKALEWAEIDANPFKNLYAPLTQLAKRRKRIVHNADLPTAEATISEPWEFHDSWQLVMWILAVSAFYYQLCISVGAATIVERRSYENHLNAMHEWVKVAKAFLAFATMPVDRQRDALQEIADMVGNIRDTLPLDADALIAEISKTGGLDEPRAS